MLPFSGNTRDLWAPCSLVQACLEKVIWISVLYKWIN